MSVAQQSIAQQITYDDLYRRWEDGNWKATELDFTEDKHGWGNVLLLGGTALERLGENGRLEYHPSHLTLRDLPEPANVRDRILAARAALA